MITFTFPASMSGLEVVQNKEMLKTNLTNLILQQGYENHVRYYYRTIKDKHLYVSCSSCRSRIIYIKKENYYEIVSAGIIHEHQAKRGDHKIIKEKIADLPSSIKASECYRLLKVQRLVSRSTFYRIYNSVKNKELSLDQIFNSFQAEKIIGHYQPLNDQQMPQLLIFSTPHMKELFLAHGQTCSFDLTFNLVRHKSRNGEDYRVGFFVGLNDMMKIIPFAFVITDREHKERMSKIFYQFFKLMGKTSEIIITDEQASIEAGLNILRFENLWDGLHILDSFHILRNVKKKLQEKMKINFFSQLIAAKNKNDFFRMLDQVEDTLTRNDQHVLQLFLKKKQSYCLAFFPPMFIGVNYSSSICQKMNDLIKQKVPFSVNLPILLRKSYELFQNLLSKKQDGEIEKLPVEKYLNITGLDKIRQSTVKKVFKIFMENLTTSFGCLISIENDEIKVFQKQCSYYVQKIFDEKHENRHWCCECRYEEKTGIPCSHIIKASQYFQESLQNIVSKKWDISKSLRTDKQLKKRRDPRKKTRRRIR